MITILLLSIGIILFFGLSVLCGKFSHKSLNSTFNKTEIKNKFLNSDKDGKINYIFFNTTPDNKTTIYVGGTNLSNSYNTKIGALATSSDNGKTWDIDQYFINTKSEFQPIVNKIMTDFYTDKDGTSDSVIVSGRYLKSTAVPNGGTSKGNGNSVSAGQIACENVYHAVGTNTINTITKTSWIDEADRDFDSSPKIPKIGISEKVIAVSTVKSYISGFIQDHIYIITTDENIDVNNIANIPYTKKDNTTTVGHSKFYAYDLFINYGIIYPSSLFDSKITALTNYLNPVSIYGTVTISTPTNDYVSKTNTFDAESSSFVFKSGTPAQSSTNDKPELDNKCLVVENQHFGASKDTSKTNPANLKAFDRPIFIQYDITKDNSGTAGAIYLQQPDDLLQVNVFNNFVVKTIAVDPGVRKDDGKDDTNLYIYAGEKDNASYMVDTDLISPESASASMIPVMPKSKTFITNADKSFISHIITFSFIDFSKNLDTKESKKDVLPIALFGKNMNSSNGNIDFPNILVTQFLSNKQNFTNQGILLGNFKSELKTDLTIVTSVSYSQASKFSSTSQAWYVDNSNNYSSTNIISFGPNYSFEVTSRNTKSLFSNKGLTKYKISKDGDGFNFYDLANKKKGIFTNTIVAVIIVIVIFFIMIVFILCYVAKLQWYKKFRINNKIKTKKLKNGKIAKSKRN